MHIHMHIYVHKRLQFGPVHAKCPAKWDNQIDA